MKYRKKNRIIFLIVNIALCVSLLLRFIYASRASAEAEQAIGLDVVAVIDASGSMGNLGGNIGKDVLIPGLMTLIDIAKVQQYPINMGVVIFNSEAFCVDDKEDKDDKLVQLNDDEKVKNFKENIEEKYVQKSGTVHTSGVAEAINLLDSSENKDNIKLIVLFTDGFHYGDSNGNGYTDGKKELAETQEKLISGDKEKGTKGAVDKGIMISTIALNPKDECDYGDLKKYSDGTGGVTERIEAKEEITKKIIETILGKAIQITDQSGSTINFDIPPNNWNIEKTIVGFTVMFESDRVTEIEVIPPDGFDVGKMIEKNGNENLIISRNNSTSNPTTSITVVKNPSWENFPYGSWSVKAKNIEDVNFYVFLDIGEPNPPVKTDAPTAETAATTAMTAETTTATTAATTLSVGGDNESETDWGVIIFIFIAVLLAVFIAIAIGAGTSSARFRGAEIVFGVDTGDSDVSDVLKLPRDSSVVALSELIKSNTSRVLEQAVKDKEVVHKYISGIKFKAQSDGGIEIRTPKPESIIRILSDDDFSFTHTFKKTIDDIDGYTKDEYKEDSSVEVMFKFSIKSKE